MMLFRKGGGGGWRVEKVVSLRRRVRDEEEFVSTSLLFWPESCVCMLCFCLTTIGKLSLHCTCD